MVPLERITGTRMVVGMRHSKLQKSGLNVTNPKPPASTLFQRTLTVGLLLGPTIVPPITVHLNPLQRSVAS